MAITVLNSPTTPNATDTKLVYSISSSNALQPQFQYVTDVYQGSTRLTRLYTYPNPTGNGIIEVSQILADNLDYDNDWKTLSTVQPDSSVKNFTLAFSESYGSSISSSTAVYAGGASSTLKAFMGTVDPNEGSFNWLGSGSNSLLTHCENGILTKQDYATVSAYANTAMAVTQSFYSENKTLLATTSSLLSTQGFYTVPIGSGSGNFDSQNWDYFVVSDGSNSFTVNRDYNCLGEGVTFAFINHFGFYDYYRVGNAVRKVTDVDRSLYSKPNVDYSSANSVYNITRRGEQQYNTAYSDRYEVTTNYIGKSEADWLTELFDSPNAYVQSNGNFIPIIVTNTNYTWNMNENRQKIFQFNIEYRYANQRYDR